MNEAELLGSQSRFIGNKLWLGIGMLTRTDRKLYAKVISLIRVQSLVSEP